MFLGLSYMMWFLIIQYVVLGVAFFYWYYRAKFRVVYKVEFYTPLEPPKLAGKIKQQTDLAKTKGKKVNVERITKTGRKIITEMLFLGSKEFDPAVPVVEFRGEAWVINTRFPAVRIHRKTIYYYDFSLRSQMWIGGKTHVNASKECLKLLNYTAGKSALDRYFGFITGSGKIDLTVVIFVILAVAVAVMVTWNIYPYVTGCWEQVPAGVIG